MSVVLEQNRILRAYAESGATDPSRSRTPEELGLARSRIFPRLVKEGVLVPCGEDRFYVDREGVEAFIRKRRARAFASLAAALLLVAAWLVLRLVLA